ncbi:T6SS immunity protein Tli4 family protein [Halopseudomonas sabulinigri]|uniref:T6SS immunity protein Tli4 family protein n=1 Tax=Halopseudomonas sabulinigri TaxID=472181 RepID=A0ABP9ZQ70_9GAMM
MNTNRLAKLFGFCLLLTSTFTAAGVPRQECLGRLIFDVQEDIEWATFNADRTMQISKGGGHDFSDMVAARGDNATYGESGAAIYVSDEVDRSALDDVYGYRRGTSILHQDYLKEELETEKRLVKQFERDNDPESASIWRKQIEKTREKISLALPTVHNLGIPDAYFVGPASAPAEAYIYRSNRVYAFFMSEAYAQGKGKEAMLDMMSRFRPRELYEVPDESGVCIPYGFIADEGKAHYSVKNSLRFTATPNVVFSIVTASANDPWDTHPKTGTYDTDYYPGYDAQKWTFKRFVEPTYIGPHLAGMDGWRLDPKPDSGEQERGWFGLAKTGGMLSPLVAVQVFTFQKGTDDLTEFTPPPEEVLPRWKALSETIEISGD